MELLVSIMGSFRNYYSWIVAVIWTFYYVNTYELILENYAWFREEPTNEF